MPHVAVLTDSTSCIPPALVRDLCIHVVPLQLNWDGHVYLDGQGLTPDEFYRRLRSSHAHPSTATPSVGQLIAAFRRAAEGADAVVAILLTETLSSTINVARRAAQEVRTPFHIVDSGTAANSQGFVVLAAARDASRGASLSQVIATAQACQKRVGLVLTMETLEHLRRGGRIGRAATFLGTQLSIQPVLALANGQVQPIAARRTRKAAIDRIVAEVHKVVREKPIRASVFHGDAAPEALALAERVQREFQCVEFFVTEFTPVMGAHTGPGTLGIAYCLEEPA